MNDNDLKVREAFSRQSGVFDELYKSNKLSEYLRGIFRQEVDKQLKPQSHILELNCGTGMDALYFASKGHKVLATDIAPGMIDQLKQKTALHESGKNVSPLLCSFNELDKIQDQKFDYITSNFGGLNCTNDLKGVLSHFSRLLDKGGKATLVIMPKTCPWELLMVFKGKFRTAFRRFRKATPAHIEGENFMCYYYNPGYVIDAMKDDFKVITLKGIFITVPPEFYQNFVERYPKLFAFLSKIDKAICNYFPFNRCCDHYLITLERK